MSDQDQAAPASNSALDFLSKIYKPSASAQQATKQDAVAAAAAAEPDKAPQAAEASSTKPLSGQTDALQEGEAGNAIGEEPPAGRQLVAQAPRAETLPEHGFHPSHILQDKEFNQNLAELNRPLGQVKMTEPPAAVKAEKSLADRMVHGAGQFGAGMIEGGLSNLDTLRGLGALTLSGGVSKNAPKKEKELAQAFREEGVEGGTLDENPSVAETAGQVAGNIATYGAAGLATGGMALAGGAAPAAASAAAVAGGTAEGVLMGAGQSASQDLAQEGKMNPAHVVGGALAGGGLGMVGGGLVAGAGLALNKAKGAIGKMIENKQEADLLKRNLGRIQETSAEAPMNAVREKIAREEKQRLNELAVQDQHLRKRILEEAREVLADHEAQELDKANKFFGEQPPENRFQQAQQRFMRDQEAQQALYGAPATRAAIVLKQDELGKLYHLQELLAHRGAPQEEIHALNQRIKQTLDDLEELGVLGHEEQGIVDLQEGLPHHEGSPTKAAETKAQEAHQAPPTKQAPSIFSSIEEAVHAFQNSKNQDLVDAAEKYIQENFGRGHAPRESKPYEIKVEHQEGAAPTEKQAEHHAEEPEAAPKTEAQGPFRLRMHNEGRGNRRGYEIIEHAQDLLSANEYLTPENFRNVVKAFNAMGEAKAWVGHLKNDVEAYAQNALKLAKSDAQKEKVIVDKKTRLKHEAADKVAKKKSELYTQQQEEKIEATQKLRDTLAAEEKTATKKDKVALREQISELDAALQKLKEPHDLWKITENKGLYGIADRRQIENTEIVPRMLGDTFKKAYAQFVQASRQLEAAEKQYAALSEHYMPLFFDAEKAMQEKVGDDQARLFLRGIISNPFSRKLPTDFALGTKFNPFTAKLNELFKKELDKYEEQLAAQESIYVSEAIYKVGGIEKLAQQSGKDAVETLRAAGALHPVAEKLALVSALGIMSLSVPAEAKDSKETKDAKDNLGKAALGLTASILALKFGVPVARRIIKSPVYYALRCWGNTRDLTEFADKALGINKMVNPELSLSHSMDSLGGKVIQSIVDAPDDARYLLKAVHKDVPEGLMSPEGQTFAEEIRDQVKKFKAHVRAYAAEWDKHYEGLSPDQQKYLSGANGAVQFLHGAVTNKHHANFVDKAAAKLFTNAASAWFTKAPKPFLAAIADLAISGPLQVGPVAIAKAMRYLAPIAGDPTIKGALDRLVLGGPRTEAVNELMAIAGKEGARRPFGLEIMQSRVMAAASMIRYFHVNPANMRAAGIQNERDFIRKMMTGQLPEQMRMDSFIQMYRDLTDTVGADPLHLVKGPLGRARLSEFLKFVNQPERYVKLITLNAAKGNWPWVVASMGAAWQLGGPAFIPASLRALGYQFSPVQTAQLIGLINTFSVGQHVLGNLTKQLDWDPFLYPLMGVMAPGFDDLMKTVGDLGHVSSQVGEVIYDVGHGGAQLLGSKMNEDNLKAQKALYTTLQGLALAFPTVGDFPFVDRIPVAGKLARNFPTRLIGSFAYSLPDFINDEAYIGDPNPVALGETRPIEPSKVKKYPGARWQALRRMLGLPDAYEVGQYQTAHSFPNAVTEHPEMLNAQLNTGIPFSEAEAQKIMR